MNNITSLSTADFYLKHSIPSLIERLKLEKGQRPLVAAILDEDLPEFIGKHLFERAGFYAKAKHTINCDKKSVATLVEEIENILN